MLFVALWGHTTTISRTNTSTAPTQTSYPVGTRDAADPSGFGPPPPHALAGYTRTYVTDFPGTSLPAGWDVFSGVPAGIPDGHFGNAHSVVGGGLLRLNTWRDPAFGGQWVTGGVCQCGFAQVYGAYFVRSRLTEPGPNEAQLLWPAANVWPPEIDFDESGGDITSAVATVHYGVANNIEQRKLSIDMARWHTWGLVWNRGSLTYTVDGHAWGSVTLPWEVPDQPMTLHLQQQASCALGLEYACPRASASMVVDWVAEYAPRKATSSRVTHVRIGEGRR